MWGRDSVVGIANRYRLEDSQFEPRSGQEIFFLHTLPVQLRDQSGLVYSRQRDFFPAIKRPGRRVEHLSGEIRNEWDYNSTLFVPLWLVTGRFYLYMLHRCFTLICVPSYS